MCDTSGMTPNPDEPSATATPMSAPRRRRLHAALRWSLALALTAAVSGIGYWLSMQAGIARLHEAASHRLDMLAGTLDAELTRFDYLPALLEMTPEVPALLDAPADGRLQAAVNRYLDGVAATAGAEMVYVLDPAGVSLAASDWNQPGTTIGQDLSFRPYVVDAVASGRGRFYGVGITSRKPGYYLSYALKRGDRLRGVVAVKVAIEAAERAWRKLPGEVLLVDERGVVILATRDDLKYRPLAPLDAAQRAEVQRSRPYGSAALTPLHWTPVAAWAGDAARVTIDGRAALATARTLQRTPWRLVAVEPLAPLRQAARGIAVSAGLAMAVLLLVAVVLWQRRRALRQRLASRAALQAAHDSLESTVAARTAELQAAHAELLHAGKLAALGQMSAVLVHELNQPLTALRTLSESAVILLEHDRRDDVRGNLRRITGMVERLARLTAQLKTFAHRDDAPSVAVTLAQGIAEAQALVDAERRQHGVDIEVDIEPAGLRVMADEAALGSLLVNLMRNAIQAMQQSPKRRLRIEVRQHDGRAAVAVADTGPGIAADMLPRLFQPFVSSKPAGAGLGLGLVIAAQLVRGVGGTLRAANQPAGGACFSFDLPLADAGEGAGR